MSDNYSYPDFMNYCTSSNDSMRAEKDVFWYNRIPVPSVLVKKIFFGADLYLRTYMDHLLTGVMLALNDLSNPSTVRFFDFFPDPERARAAKSSGETGEIWSFCQSLDSYKDFEYRATQLLGIGAFELDQLSFEACLGHKGKKYERLYYPESIKELIRGSFPRVSELLKGTNGDFFGNVIADQLNIYRSGFGDAFAGLFNRFLDFKIDVFPSIDPRFANQGQLEEVSLKSLGVVRPVDYANGFLWEPSFQQGGAIGVELDRNHPIFDVSSDRRMTLLLLALSKEEMSIFNEEAKSAVEDFRFRVSQTLKAYTQTDE